MCVCAAITRNDHRLYQSRSLWLGMSGVIGEHYQRHNWEDLKHSWNNYLGIFEREQERVSLRVGQLHLVHGLDVTMETILSNLHQFSFSYGEEHKILTPCETNTGQLCGLEQKPMTSPSLLLLALTILLLAGS